MKTKQKHKGYTALKEVLDVVWKSDAGKRNESLSRGSLIAESYDNIWRLDELTSRIGNFLSINQQIKGKYCSYLRLYDIRELGRISSYM